MSELQDLAGRVAQVSDIYAERNGIRRDDDWFALKLQEELGELIAEHLRASGRGRQRSDGPRDNAIADEAADLFAQLLLFCRHHNIDIAAALERKWFVHLKAAGPA